MPVLTKRNYYEYKYKPIFIIFWEANNIIEFPNIYLDINTWSNKQIVL